MSKLFNSINIHKLNIKRYPKKVQNPKFKVQMSKECQNPKKIFEF